ncbi:MAG: hypothetical protein ACHP7O_01220 [Burkholderiales bacterium]
MNIFRWLVAVLLLGICSFSFAQITWTNNDNGACAGHQIPNLCGPGGVYAGACNMSGAWSSTNGFITCPDEYQDIYTFISCPAGYTLVPNSVPPTCTPPASGPITCNTPSGTTNLYWIPAGTASDSSGIIPSTPPGVINANGCEAVISGNGVRCAYLASAPGVAMCDFNYTTDGSTAQSSQAAPPEVNGANNPYTNAQISVNDAPLIASNAAQDASHQAQLAATDAANAASATIPAVADAAAASAVAASNAAQQDAINAAQAVISALNYQTLQENGTDSASLAAAAAAFNATGTSSSGAAGSAKSAAIAAQNANSAAVALDNTACGGVGQPACNPTQTCGGVGQQACQSSTCGGLNQPACASVPATSCGGTGQPACAANATCGGSGQPSCTSDMCTLHPALAVCNVSTVASNCLAGVATVSCSGDAITCAIAQATADADCRSKNDAQVVANSSATVLGNQLLTGADPMGTGLPTLANAAQGTLPSQLDSSGWLGGGACLADIPMVIGTASYVFPLSQVCDWLIPLRAVMMLIASLVSYRIMSSAVLKF